MTVTLQIVDPKDSTTILFDLNDPTGANSSDYGGVQTYLVSDVDLGSPRLETSQVDSSGIDTAFTTFSRRATAPTRLGVRIKASSYDNLTKAVGRLAQYLSQGCVMRWIPTGSAFTQYIDTLPAPTPALLSGRELGLFEVLTLFDTPQGVSLEFPRQAYPRGAKLDPATNKIVTNPTILRDTNQDGLADGWTKTGAPTTSISTVLEATHVVAGSAGLGIYQNSAAASASSGQTWVVSIDVKVTSGTVALLLNWRTAADADISSVTTTTTSAGWTRIQATGTAPGTTDRVRLRVESSGAAATFDTRNAQIEQAASATPFRVCSETVYLDPATTGMAKMLPVYNPGSAWAPLEITTAFPDASTAVQQVSYSLASSSMVAGDSYLVDYLNGPYYGQAEANGNGWTLTAGTNTTLAGAADASASPGSGTSVARISHTTGPNTTQMGIRWSRSTLLDCLRGTFGVYVRMKPVANANAGYDVSIKWGTGGTVQYANDTYYLDNTASAATAYRLLYLGNITLPSEPTAPAISSLQIELWSNMNGTKTAQNLDVDYLLLSPTKDSATATTSVGTTDSTAAAYGGVPKQLGAPVGDPAWTAGTTVGTAVALATANNAIAWGGTGTGGNTGFFTGVGGIQHTCTASVIVGAFSGTYTANFQLVHFDVGGANPVVDATVTKSFSSVSGFAWTFSLSANDVAGKLYQLRMTLTAAGASGQVYVYTFTHTTSPVLTQNQQTRTDPGSVPARYAAEKLDSSGNLLVQMTATKVPFWIPPGLSLLQIETWDKQTDSNDLELAHINARTLTVKPAVYPRSWV